MRARTQSATGHAHHLCAAALLRAERVGRAVGS
jgi:hypothetical protein